MGKKRDPQQKSNGKTTDGESQPPVEALPPVDRVWNAARATAYIAEQADIEEAAGNLDNGISLRTGAAESSTTPEGTASLIQTICGWDPREADKPEVWAALFDETPAATGNAAAAPTRTWSVGRARAYLLERASMASIAEEDAQRLRDGADVACLAPDTTCALVLEVLRWNPADEDTDAFQGLFDWSPTWSDVADASTARDAAELAPTQPPVHDPREFPRDVASPLDAEEMALLNSQLLDLLDEDERLEEKGKAQAKTIKSKRDAVNAEMRELRDQLREAKVTRSVRCRLELVRGTTNMQVIRCDTGEILETRAATQEELQCAIAFEKPPAETTITDANGLVDPAPEAAAAIEPDGGAVDRPKRASVPPAMAMAQAEAGA